MPGLRGPGTFLPERGPGGRHQADQKIISRVGQLARRDFSIFDSQDRIKSRSGRDFSQTPKDEIIVETRIDGRIALDAE